MNNEFDESLPVSTSEQQLLETCTDAPAMSDQVSRILIDEDVAKIASGSKNMEDVLSMPEIDDIDSECGAVGIPSTTIDSDLPSSNNQPADILEPSEVYHKVKRIKWGKDEVPIITQNNNGPCPLLAILNAMLLKGNITLPHDRKEISGEELVSIVGNAVFDVPRNSVPSEMHGYIEQNTQDAVDILHKLFTGLDVNVKFSGVRDFEFTPELSIFDVLEVNLYHGWVVDPCCEAANLVANLSYNQLTTNIILWREEANSTKDNTLLLKAMTCEEFIAASVSQITVHGLFKLGSSLEDEEIAVLFRNNHFSTIYKKKDHLYQLLTDQGFLNEPAVWETLTDIDANFSEFVTGSFMPLPAVHKEQESIKGEEVVSKRQQINSDHMLATMLQEETEWQQQKENDFIKFVDDMGLKNLPDLELARRLQEHENSRPIGKVEKGQFEASSASVPKSAQNSKPTTPLSPNATLEERKKKECAIL